MGFFGQCAFAFIVWFSGSESVDFVLQLLDFGAELGIERLDGVGLDLEVGFEDADCVLKTYDGRRGWCHVICCAASGICNR